MSEQRSAPNTTAIETPKGTVPCPFVYVNGKPCTGHIVKVEAYKADLEWAMQKDGSWQFGYAPRSHYHLFCSEKGNHSGHGRQDDHRLKFYVDQLPQGVSDLMKEALGQKGVTAYKEYPPAVMPTARRSGTLKRNGAE